MPTHSSQIPWLITVSLRACLSEILKQRLEKRHFLNSMDCLKRHTYWSSFILNVRNKKEWWGRSDYCFIFISRVVPWTNTPGDLTLTPCFLSLSPGFLSILPSLPDTDLTDQWQLLLAVFIDFFEKWVLSCPFSLFVILSWFFLSHRYIQSELTEVFQWKCCSSCFLGKSSWKGK